jgi:hypothetical protein
VEYVKNRHTNCPKWLKYIVCIASFNRISAWKDKFSNLRPKNGKGKRSLDGVGSKNISSPTGSGIELRKKESGYDLDYDSDDDPDFENSKNTTTRINPLTRDIEIGKQKNDPTDSFKDKDIKGIYFDDIPFGWPKVASSIDRIARTIITFSFIVFVGVNLFTVMNT